MKILLHMCCGPCATFPVKALQQEKAEITGFFYNPNIHPIEEFLKRKENVEIFSHQSGIPIIAEDKFMQKEWEDFQEEEYKRCMMCYRIRLQKTAEVAKKEGFDAFSTTLLVSPYQKHDAIKEMGEQIAIDSGIDFLYRDFRPGFREGQALAKEMGLYRQKYCGCILSFHQSQKGKGDK